MFSNNADRAVAAATIIGVLAMSACTDTKAPATTDPNPFEDLPLPALATAAPLPSGTPADQAELLSAAVQSGGPDAEAALVTTLAQLELDVRDHDGNPVTPAQGSVGPPVPAWQVQFATPQGDDGTIRLTDLETMLQGIEGFEELPIATSLATDLVAAASPDTGLGAHLLLGLGPGGQDPASYDPARAGDIELSGVQTWVLLRRLAAELMSPEESDQPATTATPAAWSDGSAVVVGDASATPIAPCTFTPEQTKIVKTGSTIERKVFTTLLKKIKKLTDSAGGAAERLLATLKAVNAIVAVADGLLLFTSLTGTADLDHQPLQRTDARHPATGEEVTAQFTLRYKYRLGKEAINCLRLAFAAIGVKLPTIPTEGPVVGAVVEWKGERGFQTNEGTKEAYLQFRGRPDKGVTDRVGKTEIVIEGLGQREDVPEPRTVTHKAGEVGVLVAPVGPELWRDALEAVTTDKGLIAIGLGLLKRTRWWRMPFSFPVLDWGGALVLAGTITVDLHYDLDYGSGTVLREDGHYVVTILSELSPGATAPAAFEEARFLGTWTNIRNPTICWGDGKPCTLTGRLQSTSDGTVTVDAVDGASGSGALPLLVSIRVRDLMEDIKSTCAGDCGPASHWEDSVGSSHSVMEILADVYEGSPVELELLLTGWTAERGPDGELVHATLHQQRKTRSGDATVTGDWEIGH
jgi:hypothetical protein